MKTRYDLVGYKNTRAIEVEYKTGSQGNGYVKCKDLYRGLNFKMSYDYKYSDVADILINYLLSIGIKENEIICGSGIDKKGYVLNITNFDINLKTSEKY